jgi:His-Xaa-Ser system radical SAM maturase HxsC
MRQPPKEVDDSGRVAEHLRLIQLMSPETKELGITGGEPTLLKDGLLEVLQRCKELLPQTAVHVLSNGRLLFYYSSFARRVAEIAHPDLMFGIPLYSDLDYEHDYVVQARGAFDDTMIGLHNLGRFGVPVEIRVVIHRLTYQRLPQLAEFVYRNVPFAAHVALMGLEPMGFAIPNWEQLWIDPWDYGRDLEAATLFLAERGMTVSVYNHQFCVVPESIWPYCRQSISDWKNEYLPVCNECGVQEQCGGFFTSSLRRGISTHIRALPMCRPLAL